MSDLATLRWSGNAIRRTSKNGGFVPGADFLSLIALGQAVLLVALLLILPRGQRNRGALYLAGFFALTVLDLVVEYAHLMPLPLPDFGSTLVLPLFPLFPVFLWFYVTAATSEEDQELPQFWPHLASVGLAAAFMILAVSLPEEPRSTTGLAQFWKSSLGIHLFLWFWAFLILGYLYAIIVQLRRHRKKLKAVYSNVEGKELRWVDGLIGAILMLALLKVVQALNLSLTGIDILPGSFESLFELALVFSLGLFGVRQRPAYEPTPGLSAEDPTPRASKYEKSALSAEDCARIMVRLDAVMREAKPWLEPFLKLRDLAATSGVSENRISQALSTAEGRNFYAYVNGFRVDEAKRLLAETGLQVLEISLETGFNSKSTFNTAFKDLTGKTPTQFRKGLATAPLEAV